MDDDYIDRCIADYRLAQGHLIIRILFTTAFSISKVIRSGAESSKALHDHSVFGAGEHRQTFGTLHIHDLRGSRFSQHFSFRRETKPYSFTVTNPQTTGAITISHKATGVSSRVHTRI
jgi:hypothetical protein